MTSYGVGVSNHFYLLDEDSVSEPAKPVAAASAPSTSSKPVSSADRSQNRRGQRDGGRRQGAPTGNRRGPKREFDRHSGTGRSFENKREGKGRFNWGAQDDENGEQRRPRNQGPRRRRPKDREGQTEEASGEQQENKPEAVEEETPEVEQTVDSDAEKQDLSEYLKQMEELRVDDDANLSIRQAVDDDDQFKATETFTRSADSDDEDPLIAGSVSKASRKNRNKKASKKKPVISLDEFTKGQRQRRNYRHHESGSGYRRRSNEERATASVDIDDKSAFPALISAQ